MRSRSASMTRKVNWVLDADIRGFFDTFDHEWLVKFVEHRMADRRVVRLIQKWLNAGVLEDGKRTRSEEGTVQGGSIAAAGQHLSALRVRPVGPTMASNAGARRCDRRAVRGRHRGGIPARADAERFLAELRERFAQVRPGTASREDAAASSSAAVRPKPARAWRRETGDLQLSGLHAQLREDEGRDGSRCCGRRCAGDCRRS